MFSYQSFLRLAAGICCIIITLSASAQLNYAATFSNPLVKTENAACAAENLQNLYFSGDFETSEQLKICSAINNISEKLNSTVWSPQVARELTAVWNVFSHQPIVLRRMPAEIDTNILAMADPAEAIGNTEKFSAIVYLRPEKIESRHFLLIMVHELRHVYDFHESWAKSESLSSLEVERRGFLLMSKVSRDSGLKAPGIPKFWKSKWTALPDDESAVKSIAEIDKYLARVKSYRHLFGSRVPVYDFSRHQDFAEIKAKISGDEKLIPIKPVEIIDAGGKPASAVSAAQAISDGAASTDKQAQQIFNLEKPVGQTDPSALLRIALANELKLAEHVRALVYDQKTQFQCLENGKITGTFSALNNDLRADQTFLKPVRTKTLLALPEKSKACADNSLETKNELIASYFARPEIARSQISFSGYVQIENRSLAEYAVNFPEVSGDAVAATSTPERIFKSKIYVSPEDAQIVRFHGIDSFSSAPNGDFSRIAAPESVPVIAIRRKMNLNRGVWVTAYVASIAVDELATAQLAYRFSSSFQNFRFIESREIREPETSVQPFSEPSSEWCYDEVFGSY